MCAPRQNVDPGVAFADSSIELAFASPSDKTPAMPSFEVPSPESPRRVTATELDSTAEVAEQLDAAALALLLVAVPDVEPSLEDVVATLQHAVPELTVVRLEPDTVDPSMLWFYIDALPRLRRLRLPENRLLLGFYLFEQASLRGWHPLTRFAGLWVQQLIAQQVRWNAVRSGAATPRR